MDRQDFIGGSDVAAVLGQSRWKTPLQLWAEKTGEVEPKDLSGIEAVELGTDLEDFCAKRFERKTGFPVRRTGSTYVHKVHQFMRCQVDRLLTGTDYLLEVKTCSAWKEKEWSGDEVPAEYILQVQWQLMITGKTLGYICVLIGGQKFLYKEIHPDQELHDMMKERAIAFWKMVEDRTPPSAMLGDDDVLLSLHPRSNNEIQMIQEKNDQIRHLQELKMHIKELEEQKDGIEVQLKDIIGDNLGIKTSEYCVKWTPMEQSRVDVEKLKADGIYDLYKKTSGSRRLTVTKNKGD